MHQFQFCSRLLNKPFFSVLSKFSCGLKTSFDRLSPMLREVVLSTIPAKR
nr:MAG TPA: hypothetical protein [Caudoviricetes sp.]